MGYHTLVSSIDNVDYITYVSSTAQRLIK